MLSKIGYFGNSSGSSKRDREHSLADLSANELFSESRSWYDRGFARNAELREMRADRVSDIGRR
jgi:hypothetical protein